MTALDMGVRGLRQCHQRIEGPPLDTPEDVVRWMGAVQSQDYGQAAWALGLRAASATAAGIDRALAEGTILRTHVMRPTWHFVSPEDIRWLLALTGPRVKAGSAGRLRELELDAAILLRSHKILAKALEGGISLTRDELGQVLENAGVETSMPQRLVYILMTAELDGIICSGPKRGKQFTYALLEERVPRGRAMDRDEAVVELVRRYFTSHGPATTRDFAWWSGLTTADARAGLEALKGQIVGEKVDGKTYWFPRKGTPLPDPPSVHLLPAFDEYTVAYADRRDILRPEHSPQSSSVMLGPVVVVDGYVVGNWKRTLRKGTVVMEVNAFTEMGEAERGSVATAAGRYGEFLGMPAVLS